MNGCFFFKVLVLSMLAGVAGAQQDEGLRHAWMGHWEVFPSVRAMSAYNSRSGAKESSQQLSEAYFDMEVGLRVKNRPARFDVSGDIAYAYRYYRDRAENDERYSLSAGVASRKNALIWQLKARLRRTLDYDTEVDLEADRELGTILSNEAKNTYSLSLSTSYPNYLTDKSSLTPGYRYAYFYEDTAGGSDRRWQIHSASLRYGYRYSEMTEATLIGSYGFQLNSDEKGAVIQLLAGLAYEATEKVDVSLQVGAASAIYEESGSDFSLVAQLRGTWRATPKTSVYVFGGNDYQPGYDGGSARMVYRLGCGSRWQIKERWSSGIQLLHRSERAVSGGAVDRKSFATVSSEYALTLGVSLDASVRWSVDSDRDGYLVGLGCLWVF